MSVTPATHASLLTIFGATGDLAQRMLLPSLYSLQAERLLPEGMRILGTARSELDREGFAQLVADSIQQRIPAHERSEEALRGLLERLDYLPASADDDASMAALAARVQALRAGDVLYHMSTAPKFYGPACQALAAHGAAGPGTRVMLEKPIGKDLASAIAINDAVARAFDEERVYRVDHYLGKEGVQNLIALRFGNALFEPLWNARHVEQVQITVAETVGVEGRGDYYDDAGALRDMLQNHLLQLLCLVAMEPPARFDPTAVRNEKIKVLRSLRAIDASNVATESVAGQYTAGAIDGAAVPGYVEELGRPSRTETFVALRAHVDNWRWSGVPFYLRTGKRLPARSTEIYLQFRKVPYSIFGGAAAADMRPNGLLIKLQPEERIELDLMSKTPGLDRHGLRLSQVALDLDFHQEFSSARRRIAYERLYLDAIEGNGTLFVRRDETEAAWQWVDAIAAGWRDAGMLPRPYPAGTWGPGAAISLVDRLGHGWRE
ncbi:glucose-6-phosphate 1-dehydrogenase [Thermomonas haemolytica]|uniref:Glucose-6-phosphate 1-dehydrogenase n=1 Tax=Thermomonas haemolytica TaxID=141949 RepID=A0A4R3NBU3_9GAMM|nr:glucose-6-phosphate dehydrogenase [Thermomonas haemolytica]TCT25876.1 glucose-6-phosphate 1-dehydrogenase [Thermomonas haemolytica]TNY28582.1 glucose-6-phosphate dehydrogenase [Thermomonas haemolytica]